jgi:hypothetical protein
MHWVSGHWRSSRGRASRSHTPWGLISWIFLGAVVVLVLWSLHAGPIGR